MSFPQQTLEFVSELIWDRYFVSESAIIGLCAFLSCSVLRIFRMSNLKGNFSLLSLLVFLDALQEFGCVCSGSRDWRSVGAHILWPLNFAFSPFYVLCGWVERWSRPPRHCLSSRSPQTWSRHKHSSHSGESFDSVGSSARSAFKGLNHLQHKGLVCRAAFPRSEEVPTEGQRTVYLTGSFGSRDYSGCLCLCVKWTHVRTSPEGRWFFAINPPFPSWHFSSLHQWVLPFTASHQTGKLVFGPLRYECICLITRCR